MGRDRAKEKICARKEARLERKEAKTGQREQDETRRRRDFDKGRKVRRRDNSMINTTGQLEDSLLNAANLEASGDCFELGTSKRNNREDAAGNAFFVEPVESPRSNLFDSGNPNRTEFKPSWKFEHEPKRGRNLDSSSVSDELSTSVCVPTSVEDMRLEDYLHSDEIYCLKEILIEIRYMEGISVPVAAVAMKRYSLLKKLLKETCSRLCPEGKQSLTPLGCAIITNNRDNFEMIGYLLEKDESACVKDNFGNTPLLKAAICSTWNEGLFLEFWTLLKDRKIVPDVLGINEAGVSLVHALSFRGWTASLNSILEFISSTNGPKVLLSCVNAAMKDGTTPLMLSAHKEESVDTCALLLLKGAEVLAEDKAGFTAICRSLSFNLPTMCKISKNSEEQLPKIFERLMIHLDDDLDSDWNFEYYTLKAINIAATPSWDYYYCERLHRLGRFVFLFCLRSVAGGATLMLKSKIFSKLSLAGKNHIVQSDFVYTICLIIFEVLVYAEDLVHIWPKYADSFVKDGAADFCLKVLQRFTSVVNDDEDENSFLASKCYCSDTWTEFPESLAHIEKSLPLETNVALCALMPFIQLIDTAQLDRWFSKNFSVLSSCYKNIKQLYRSLPTLLSPEHAERTNKKAAIFHGMMAQERWLSICGDSEQFKEKGPKNKRDKFNRENNSAKKEGELTKNLKTVLKLPPNFQQNQEIIKEVTKITKRRLEEEVPKQETFCIPSLPVKSATVNTIEVEGELINLAKKSLSSTSIDSNDPKHTPKFIKDKVNLGSFFEKPPVWKKEMPNLAKAKTCQSQSKEMPTKRKPLSSPLPNESHPSSNNDKATVLESILGLPPIFEYDLSTAISCLSGSSDTEEALARLDICPPQLIRVLASKLFSNEVVTSAAGENIMAQLEEIGSKLSARMLLKKKKQQERQKRVQKSGVKQESPDSSFRLLTADDEAVKLELLMKETDFVYLFRKIRNLLLTWTLPEGQSISCPSSIEIWKRIREDWMTHSFELISPDPFIMTPKLISDFNNINVSFLRFNSPLELKVLGLRRIYSNSRREMEDFRARANFLFDVLSREYYLTICRHSIAFGNMSLDANLNFFSLDKRMDPFAFTLNRWDPETHIKKYFYKPFSDAPAAELFQDVLKSFPALSPLVKEQTYMLNGEITRNIMGEICIPIQTPNEKRFQNDRIQQLELSLEGVYMKSIFWNDGVGIFRNMPDSLKEFALGKIRTELGSINDSGVLSIEIYNYVSDEPKQEDFDPSAPKTEKFSVYNNAEKFEAFRREKPPFKGPFCQPASVSYSDDEDNEEDEQLMLKLDKCTNAVFHLDLTNVMWSQNILKKGLIIPVEEKTQKHEPIKKQNIEKINSSRKTQNAFTQTFITSKIT